MGRLVFLFTWVFLSMLISPGCCPGQGGLSPEFLTRIHARVEEKDRAVLLEVELMSQVAENAELRRELVSRLSAPEVGENLEWSRKVLQNSAEFTLAEQAAAATIASRGGARSASSILRAHSPTRARETITGRMKFVSDLEAATSYTLPLMRVRPEIKDKFLGGLSRPLVAEDLKIIRAAIASGSYDGGGDPKLHRDELIFFLCLHLNATLDPDLLDQLWSREGSLGIPSLTVQRMSLLDILGECRGESARRWTLSKFRELRDSEAVSQDDKMLLGGTFYYLQKQCGTPDVTDFILETVTRKPGNYYESWLPDLILMLSYSRNPSAKPPPALDEIMKWSQANLDAAQEALATFPVDPATGR